MVQLKKLNDDLEDYEVELNGNVKRRINELQQQRIYNENTSVTEKQPDVQDLQEKMFSVKDCIKNIESINKVTNFRTISNEPNANNLLSAPVEKTHTQTVKQVLESNIFESQGKLVSEKSIDTVNIKNDGLRNISEQYVSLGKKNEEISITGLYTEKATDRAREPGQLNLHLSDIRPFHKPEIKYKKDEESIFESEVTSVSSAETQSIPQDFKNVEFKSTELQKPQVRFVCKDISGILTDQYSHVSSDSDKEDANENPLSIGRKILTHVVSKTQITPSEFSHLERSRESQLAGKVEHVISKPIDIIQSQQRLQEISKDMLHSFESDVTSVSSLDTQTIQQGIKKVEAKSTELQQSQLASVKDTLAEDYLHESSDSDEEDDKESPLSIGQKVVAPVKSKTQIKPSEFTDSERSHVSPFEGKLDRVISNPVDIIQSQHSLQEMSKDILHSFESDVTSVSSLHTQNIPQGIKKVETKSTELEQSQLPSLKDSLTTDYLHESSDSDEEDDKESPLSIGQKVVAPVESKTQITPS